MCVCVCVYVCVCEWVNECVYVRGVTLLALSSGRGQSQGVQFV